MPSSQSPNDIPRNILAFRTITTMLGLIQQERPFKISDLKIPAEHDRELKITSALANVAVAQHEIVAVATVHSAEELEVIACTQSSSDKPSPSQSAIVRQPPRWRFLFTKNPRRDEAYILENCPRTVVVDGKGLPDEEKLRGYVENCR